MRNNPIKQQSAPTYEAVIHIGGDYDTAINALREWTMRGACVSVNREAFVYTGGMEDGVAVRIINYPRFPSESSVLENLAVQIAEFLIDRLHQQSCCIVTPQDTFWLSRRGEA